MIFKKAPKLNNFQAICRLKIRRVQAKLSPQRISFQHECLQTNQQVRIEEPRGQDLWWNFVSIETR